MKLVPIDYNGGQIWVTEEKLPIAPYSATYNGNNVIIFKGENEVIKNFGDLKVPRVHGQSPNLNLPDIPYVTEFEVWKDIIGFEGLYQVSNQGRVRTVSRLIIKRDGVKQVLKEVILTPIKAKYKYYYYVNLNRAECKSEHNLIHQLVASHFLGNPSNYKIIQHIDGNIYNNNFYNLKGNYISV